MNKKVYISILIVVLLIAIYFISIKAFTACCSGTIKVENKEILDTNIINTSTSTDKSTEIIKVEKVNKKSMNKITIETNKGKIVFNTYDNDAPKTVNNFITLAKKDFYNGVIFHRVIKGFMIQGGDPTGTGRGGPGYTFEDELNPNTESYKNGYKRGVVAMANAGPNTNGSQFFIMHNDTPLPNNYSIFGYVVSGMDTVDSIANSPTDANDRPLENVVINKVIVEDLK